MIKFEKLAVDRGELWVAKVAGQTVSYRWSWISTNSGAAFARNHGTSGVRFEIRIEKVHADGSFDRKVMEEKIIDRVHYMADARQVGRKYIRETGKAQAVTVAEAVLIEAQV